MRRLPHHIGHTMEVWILKELRTHGPFSLRTTVRMTRVTVQEVDDTTCVTLMVNQVIRKPRGVCSEWQISKKGVRSNLGPVFRIEQRISSPLGIQFVWSGCLQAGTSIMKAGVVAGRAQISVHAAVTMTLGCMAARGSRLTTFARYRQRSIRASFQGFSWSSQSSYPYALVSSS